MPTCPACGAEHPAGARFCPACGTALDQVCPVCDAPVTPGAAFCTRCGASLAGAAAIDEEPSPREGAERPPLPSLAERKVVSVLFADLAGSTGMSERLDPETTAEVLRTYFEAMREEAEAEGGRVEKFIGDAVMAAFGVPVVHEDDPDRAVRAGIAMLQRLERVNEELAGTHGVTLSIRVGVNTGGVLATIDAAPGEAMVTGDVVNVAARLQSAAEPGEVLVSERTARAARSFAYDDRGGLELKGRREPVRAFAVTGTSTAPARGVKDLRAPMVGRDSELAVLHSVLERSTLERRPHLVTVYGEPGVGKSRLLREFVEGVGDDDDAAPLVMVGRCLPYGDGITYWPLAEVLKGYALVRDSDSEDVALARIRHAVAELLEGDPVGVDPVETAATLAYTLGLTDPGLTLPVGDPILVRQRLHASWRAFFSAATRHGPVLLVIEDIHWADAALLDLLEETTERVEGPLVLACTARPDLVAARPSWGGGRRNAVSVELDRLEPEQAQELVHLLMDVDDLPPSVHRRILAAAEGNPFFIEEILLRLIDEGTVVRDGGRWRALPGADTVQIPDSVQGVLAARIDLLDPDDKRVLQAAAVVGRVFWTEPVHLLAGNGHAPMAQLGVLEERDLVQSRLGSSLVGQTEYHFKHILTRDVAYDSIPRRERSTSHAVVARWLERTTGSRSGEFVDLLAHHYATAVRLARDSGDEADEGLRAAAFSWLMRASRDARSRLVLARAQRFAHEAVQLAADDLEKCAALQALSVAYSADSRGDLGWRYMREAALVADASPIVDDVRTAALMALACEIPTRWPGTMSKQVDEAEVRRMRDRGLELVPSGDVRERAHLLAITAGWPFAFPDVVGDDIDVSPYRDAGLEGADIAMRIGDVDLESGALDQAAGANAYRGHYGAALDIWTRRFALRDRLSNDLEIGDLYAMGAWMHFELGRYAEAVEYAVQVADRTNELSGGMHARAWGVVALFRLGRWDEALASVDVLRDQLDDRRDNPPGYAMHAFGAGAMMLRLRDLLPESERMAAAIDQARVRNSVRAYPWQIWLLDQERDVAGAQALVLTPLQSWQTHAGLVHEARCDTALAAADWAAARDVASAARAHAVVAPAPSTEAFADRLDGAATLGLGDPVAAIAMLEAAGSRFRACGAVWEQARTRLLLEVALRRAGRSAEADQARTRAQETLDRLGVVEDAVLDLAREALGSG